MSILTERFVFNQLYESLINSYLLTESQSGFRPCMFYTETALLGVTNEWLWNIDNKQNLKRKLWTPWTMLLFWKSLNSMRSIVLLLNGFGPTYLTERSKTLLLDLNLIPVM